MKWDVEGASPRMTVSTEKLALPLLAFQYFVRTSWKTLCKDTTWKGVADKCGRFAENVVKGLCPMASHQASFLSYGNSFPPEPIARLSW